ncbi:MAG: hypothetical protein IIB33_05615 [Chloroflexi bacterium]|nr:hypothetical protein [Chloroflexota bacterium]
MTAHTHRWSRPNYAEAHFNIARLYEHAGDDLAAVRHLRTYRELTKS